MKRRKYAGIPLMLEPKPHALATVSRCCLILLGFKGVRDFAKRAGVGHDTAGHALCTSPGGDAEGRKYWKKRHRMIVQVYEALYSAYVDRRDRMTPAIRAFVIDFIQSWQEWVLSEKLWIEAPGRMNKLGVSKHSARQRDKKRAQVRASVKAVFDAADWK